MSDQATTSTDSSQSQVLPSDNILTAYVRDRLASGEVPSEFVHPVYGTDLFEIYIRLAHEMGSQGTPLQLHIPEQRLDGDANSDVINIPRLSVFQPAVPTLPTPAREALFEDQKLWGVHDKADEPTEGIGDDFCDKLLPCLEVKRSMVPVGGANGTVDRVLRRGGNKAKFTGAIFIHAGAGFHSHQNERVHLEACSDAAIMGMAFLKSGASATEAIEAALRVLEDKEITNAGYGSNLSMDGTVECDATIVDHLGRSGACGATPMVRNPICLAKLILDKSNQPLTLRRVPPNILVGEGATLFAEKNGMQVVPNDFLISKNARDRFVRWQEDLKRAEAKLVEERPGKVQGKDVAGSSPDSCQYETSPAAAVDHSRVGSNRQRDHANAILTGTWNEGQPDSPHRGSPAQEIQGTNSSNPLRASSRQAVDRSPLSFLGSLNSPKGGTKRSRFTSRQENDTVSDAVFHPTHESHRDGSASPQRANEQQTPQNASTVQRQHQGPRGIKRPLLSIKSEEEDNVTDTIGAIAIDEKGNIAAGSSSGGIGMKHRGRLGPAALVGIGTAVVPCDPDDTDRISVAAVTSGTGEHMATTMASQRCAERLFNNTRRGPHGQDIPEDDEDLIMESFISKDFMDHPGVKNCNSVGAIGVMAVKKTRGGYYFYFAHNTDSFALTSMGGSDKEPMCVMSRLGEGSQVARGARKLRLD